MKFASNLIQRAVEPSTSAGVAVLLGLFGASPDTSQAVVNLVATAAGVAGAGPVTPQGVVALGGAVFAVAAMFLREKGKGSPPSS